MQRMKWMALVALLFARPVSADIKIAYVDGLSGPFANVGEQGLMHFKAVVDRVNAAGGVVGGQKLVVVPFDSKSTPQDALVAFKALTDQGIRIVTHGTGSGVAAALIDAANKQAVRDPEHSVIYLNYAAVDPDLTNGKCSFWHFRFDANTEQKMDGLTTFIAGQPKVKKVYVIGQDYAHGHQVAKAAVAMLKKKRPDIQVVGNDLHPSGKVKDFSPYIAKIKASGADAVITGNWGNDLALLVKAARDVGLKAKFYTYYGGGIGVPTAYGAAGADLVYQISEYHLNIPTSLEQYAIQYRKKYNEDFYYLRVFTEIEMLAKAMNQANSADPAKIAAALEGMRYQAATGEVWMRKDDHQLMQPLYISEFVKADGKSLKYDVENTGYGWRTIATIPAKDTALPTTCGMQRP